MNEVKVNNRPYKAPTFKGIARRSNAISKARTLNRDQKKEIVRIIKSKQDSKNEKKYWDTTGTLSVSYSGTITDLTDPIQGISDTSRVGDSIYIRSNTMRFYIVAQDTYNIFRVIIFQWFSDSNVSVPIASDILRPSGVGSIHAPIAPAHWDKKSQRTILFDQTYKVSNVNGDNTAIDKAYIIGGMKRKVHFNSGGVTGTNKIYMLTISDSSVSSHPQLMFENRLVYNDN